MGWWIWKLIIKKRGTCSCNIIHTNLLISLEASKWAFHLAVEWKVRMLQDDLDDIWAFSMLDKLAPILRKPTICICLLLVWMIESIKESLIYRTRKVQRIKHPWKRIGFFANCHVSKYSNGRLPYMSWVRRIEHIFNVWSMFQSWMGFLSILSGT